MPATEQQQDQQDRQQQQSSPHLEAPPVARPHLPLGFVVAIACAATFMIVLDTAIVNVALPAMRSSLHLSTSAQQWVVDAYLLTFGGLLLLAAKAADLFGRRRVFVAGLAVFTVASLVAGLADNGTMLLIARAVQGAGASALAPSGLSLITASHHDEHRRARALSIWGACASSSAAAGVVLGGVLTESLDWRWIFFVNVPIGIVLLVASLRVLLPGRPGGRTARLDIPGGLTSTAGVAALVYGISRATEIGWGAGTVIGSIAAGVALLVGFVAIEATSREPMIRLGLFALPRLRAANLAMFGLGTCMTAPLFFLSLYLQQLVGYSALRAGLALLPMSALLAIGAVVARRLLHAGVHRLPTYGAIVTAAGLLWLTQLPDHAAYASHVLGPTLVLAAGLGVMILPLTIAATAGVPHHEAGVASGLVNVGRQLGGAVGLAVLVTVSSSATQNSHDRSIIDATLHGYHLAFLIAAGVSVLCALATLPLGNRREPAATAGH
jgi:EmrB/QacA subfamily drug resistance transporter